MARALVDDLKAAMQHAVTDAIVFQRELHVREEEDARRAIEAAGGEIVAPIGNEHDAFVTAVRPLITDARQQYGADLLALVGRTLV